MPSRNDIINEINNYKNTGQDIIRRNYIKELADYTKFDTIVYASAFTLGRPGIPQNILSINLNDIQGYMTCLNGLHGDHLDLILHSPGGSLEAAEQTVQYLRSKYNFIRAIIPQNAMSAATMIACACDEIVMGKESAIGPIDPQMNVPGPNNSILSIPAHSILEDFNTAKNEVSANPNLAPIWVPKIMAIPSGFLNLCQQTISLSKSKVETWLNTYMFKGKTPQGKQIADFLGDFSQHKTHGRPINFDIAQAQGLSVTRLENDQTLQELVLSVFHSTMITFEVTPCVKLIENQNSKGMYFVLG
jgi:hypothetical protein